MARERYVLLGLARARAAWVRDVGAWAYADAIPAEFEKCASPDKLRAHLASGRAYSAALLDGALPSVDRDLVGAVRDAGSVPLIVEERATGRDWAALGAAATLEAPLSRERLLEALTTHATTVRRADLAGTALRAAEPVLGQPGIVAAVCGPGGTGASTAAIALTQGLAADEVAVRGLLLADFCRAAEQSMLHDARDIVPGVQELVEAHRSAKLSAEEVTDLTFEIAERGYRLLLGLRRAQFWPAVKPRAFTDAFDSLRRAFGAIVCDVDADFEGEHTSGAREVEERNLMARTAARAADAVFVVGLPGMKGTFALVRVLSDLIELGVAPRRLVPVFNQVPRNPRVRAELAAALSALVRTGSLPAGELAAPLFLPQRRTDEALRDGVAVPSPLPELLAGALRATMARAGEVTEDEEGPEPVVPGSLGSWAAAGGR